MLEFLAKKIVAKPDSVIVQQVEGERGPIIELEVDPDDLGKVIGRGGRVAQALRTLVRASAEGRVTVDIVDVDEDDVEAEIDAEHTPAPEGDDAQ
ncbi:MAG: KH domain-containing protein [Candidatus Velthaea sp.]